ncbi:MAG: hypothetical protein JO134_00090 [Xanthobacteraceae bacterium]|nr:hypothetical protein [Xanthobacteraceae bacterium]
MTLSPNEAATSLREIASVEQRTRAALFYAGSSMIFILWGVLVAAGYGLSELYPHAARIIWLAISAAGCAATVTIVRRRMRARPRETRDWRLSFAVVALTIFASAWSYLLGPLLPRAMNYAFQPSLLLLGIVLAGLWIGRFLIILGLAGIALIIAGAFVPEPWLRLWMAVVESGTLIIGGLWLRRSGLPK